ncbi:MAG TPA: stage III sporulation protein AE [Peptococcaceae bacterium]|nr:stage III sporulation protein AE [Peptococcaceae bacterium]
MVLILLVGACFCPGMSWAEEQENSLPFVGELVDLSQEIDLSQIKEMLKELDKDVQKALPDFSLSQIFEDLRTGKINLSPQNLGENILKAILKEVVINAPLIGQMLVLAVLCAVLNQLHLAFSGQVGQVARLLVYLVLFGLAITSFRIALDIGNQAIENMVSFMQATLPVMYAVLLAMGNLTSTALFKPIVMGSLVFLASVMKNIVLPLFFFSIVLKLLNNVSPNFKLNRFASLLEFGGKLSIGLVLTVFIGIMSIQGIAGGVADGVTLRTAKYSADLIPVVGKFFKDAVELVVASGLLLKNALGLIALLAIVFITLSPVIKIVAMMFTFKISSALVEPLGERELADSLQEMSKGLLFIFVAVASVGIMFFMAIAIIVGAGNLAVMLR